MHSVAIEVVPAPMREGCERSEQTLDYAGSIRNEQSEWSMVPAPRLELGTPWCLLRRLDISNYSQVLYQLS